MQIYKLERVIKTELTGRNLLRGEGPQWTAGTSKKMKKKNVSGPLIIVVQMNDVGKFPHHPHVDVPYCIKTIFFHIF
jgi:hypothetical protein